MDRCIIVHYHEIGLKRKNRDFFENKLRLNIELALRGLTYDGIRRISGRHVIRLNPDSEIAEITDRLRRVFGIVYFAVAWVGSQNLDALKEEAWRLLRDTPFSSFKVAAKRSEKSLPFTSQEINETVGAHIFEKSNARVDLTNPELTCYIEVVERYAFIYFKREKGAGGLPVSTGGQVVSLLSGGIDSPVASYKVLKRGCKVIFLHFHSFPHTTIDSQEKAKRIAQLLSAYQFDSKLYLVPFADIQRKIVALAPPGLRVVLYRRFMMRIAEAIASKEGATALITGESIGQVASQTLENIRVISHAVTIPILRPLIGDDKQEIIDLAKEIGTYEISILPDQDCCTLFIPKHPDTRANLGLVEEAEKNLDIEGLVSEATAGVQISVFCSQPVGR